MLKFTLVLATLLAFGFGFFSLVSNYKANSTSYTVTAKALKNPITIDSKAQVIALMLNETLFINKGKSHCHQKVLFWNLRTGYVVCGLQAGESVYHTVNTEYFPDNMYFTREELEL